MRIITCLSVIVALSGCQPTRNASPQFSRKEPYIEALYAMTNIGGCRGQGERIGASPSEIKSQEQHIRTIEADFLRAENLARQNGMESYLAHGREYFVGRVMSELLAACYPSETVALQDARAAVREFGAYIAGQKR
jgi:hypothetical protein